MLVLTLIIVMPVLALIIWREVLSPSTKSKVKGWHWLMVIAVMLFSGWYAIKRDEADDAIKAFEAAKNYTVNGVKNPYGIEELLYMGDVIRLYVDAGEKDQEESICQVRIYHLSQEQFNRQQLDYLNKIDSIEDEYNKKKAKEYSEGEYMWVDIMSKDKWIKWPYIDRNDYYNVIKYKDEADALFNRVDTCLNGLNDSRQDLNLEKKYPLFISPRGVLKNVVRQNSKNSTFAKINMLCHGAAFINIEQSLYLMMKFEWDTCRKRALELNDLRNNFNNNQHW